MKTVILQQLAKEKSKEALKKAIKKSVTKNIKSKDKPKVRKGQFASYKEARDAAIKAGKKVFNFGGKKNIPVTRKYNRQKDLSDLQKGMSTEEKKKFIGQRANELNKLRKAQLKEMMADKYGGGSSSGGVRVQKLTPEVERLLKENKLDVIVNAQKFIKFKTKDGKTKIVPSNKYIIEGIGSRDAPLVPKGAVPKTAQDKKIFREVFENEMNDSERLEYILKRYEPQYTTSQLADILGITARDLTATIKGGAGKYKQYGIGESELQALKDKFQVRAISKDMKTGGMVKYKAGTGKKTVGSKVKKLGKGALSLANKGMNLYMPIEILDLMTSAAFKKGTQGKTIRGVGKAMRGYGKAMIKGRKK